jgi:outer membrane protein assembly factor BamB
LQRPNCPRNVYKPSNKIRNALKGALAPFDKLLLTDNGPKTIIGAGQKSGIYYALDPDTGALLWQTQVGPGSSLGGIEWGSASDGTICTAFCTAF